MTADIDQPPSDAGKIRHGGVAFSQETKQDSMKSGHVNDPVRMLSTVENESVVEHGMSVSQVLTEVSFKKANS